MICSFCKKQEAIARIKPKDQIKEFVFIHSMNCPDNGSWRHTICFKCLLHKIMLWTLKGIQVDCDDCFGGIKLKEFIEKEKKNEMRSL